MPNQIQILRLERQFENRLCLPGFIDIQVGDIQLIHRECKDFQQELYFKSIKFSEMSEQDLNRIS